MSESAAPRDPLRPGVDRATSVRAMFDRIADRYDVLNRSLTFGMDVAWRRRAVRSLRLPGGSLVLDVACGTGDLCRELRSSGYRAFGFDLAFRMLTNARTTVPLAQADALAMPVATGRADGLTCGFALRNVVDLDRLFQEMARVLRPGGRVAILEVSEPSNRLLRAGHSVYFNHVVPFVGGIVSDREAYRYLPRSVRFLPSPPELTAALRRAGFSDARRGVLCGGVAQLLVGTRA